MRTIYGIYFTNFDYTEWFDTEKAALAFAKKSGYEYILRTSDRH